MRALFIHDHPFIRKSGTGEIFTSGNLNSSLWERYLKHFDSLTVMGRCKVEDDTSRYNFAEYENVNFNLFDNVKGGIDYFKKSKYIKRRIISEIKKHDIIILRLPAMLSIYAADYCIKNNIKYIVEVVGCVWDANWNYGGFLPKILAPYSYVKMQQVVKKSFASIYVTKFFLQKRYPSNSKITTNASNVIIKKLDENVLDNRLSKIKSHTIDDTITLGLIGNINVKYKGFDVLLEALSHLPSGIKDKLKVLIVGGGDPSYIKSLITKYNLGEQIILIGKLKAGEEIFSFLDSIDIYVHPSRQEGLPRVVIEAMSRACPVLASSVAGIPELINDKFLHKPGDQKKLTNDLIKLINDCDLQMNSAFENYNKAKDYLFDNLERRREQFFNDLKRSF